MRRADWEAYLHRVVVSFKLATGGVKEETQIHTPLCYAEFNDLIIAIFSICSANHFVLAASIKYALVFILSLWLVRSQATVGDVSYMRAINPHHSIANLTSECAQIKDPRVRKLADGIISAQV